MPIPLCRALGRSRRTFLSLKNFGVVRDRLWRCAQPSERGLRTLKSLGATHVFKLNTDGLEFDNEVEIIGEGTEFPGVSPLAPRDSLLITAAESIDQFVTAGKTVVVHCYYGRDRTGAVCATYQILFCDDLKWKDIRAEFLAYDNEEISYHIPITETKVLDALKRIYKAIRKEDPVDE